MIYTQTYIEHTIKHTYTESHPNTQRCRHTNASAQSHIKRQTNGTHSQKQTQVQTGTQKYINIQTDTYTDTQTHTNAQ